MSTMVSSRQVLDNHHRGANENGYENIHMDAPRFAALVVCTRAVYLVFTTCGFVLGFISAILTAICVTPLFNSSAEGVGQVSPEATPEQDHSSHIFTEAPAYELNIMREEEHSVFGRLVQQGVEIWSEDVDELVYVAQVLRENQGLLFLLAGGVSSMVMALVAGLDDVNVLKALLISITCYGVTTLLVARSARRIVGQNILQRGESKLSSDEVTKIIDAIPEEDFVPNDELENCDLLCIENMLRCRGIILSQKASTGIEGSGCAPQDVGIKKENLIDELRQRRNYDDSCCICLSTFDRGDRVRVLPSCHHEFHRRCIDKWAETFAASNRRSHCNTKRGRPTCPLCKICLGEAQVCLPATSSHS